ncbi:MAG: fibronectin type III domain-containing protein [Patescibacteria group bacterium]
MKSRQSKTSDLRKQLKEALARLRIYRVKYRIQMIISVFLVLVIVVLVTQWPFTRAADSPWTQTDWSGGVGSSTVDEYASGSNIDATTTAGQVSVSATEEFSDTGVDDSSDLDSWLGIDPTTISGLEFYGRADAEAYNDNGSTLATDGQTVQVWGDQSSSNNDASQTSASRRPTYETDELNSRAVLQFSPDVDTAGNGEVLYVDLTSIASITDITVISVASFDYTNQPSSNYDYLYFIYNPASPSNGSSISRYAPGGTADDYYNYYNGGVANGPNIDSGFQIFSQQVSNTGNRHFLWFNGVSQSVSAIGSQATFSSPRLAIGKWADGTWNLNGRIAEFMIYDEVISAADRHGVENFLANKFNLGSTLTLDTDTKRNGAGSAKVVSGTNTVELLQNVNVGDTNSYTLVAYAYTDGSEVTDADVELYANGSTVTTAFTADAGGWYKLTGTVTGAASSRTYGVQVKASKTVYVDDFSLSDYESTGTLTSNIFNTEFSADWGNLAYNSSGSGTVAVKVRTSDSAVMFGAPDFSTCTAIGSGSDMSANSCVTDTEQYVQYQLTLTPSGGNTPIFEDNSIAFTPSDVTPPTNPDTINGYSENGGDAITTATWYNHTGPYFTWAGAADAAGPEGNPSGVHGYWVCFGAVSCDPTAGSYSTDANYTAAPSSSGTYYLRIKTQDVAGNKAVATWTAFTFKYDATDPGNPSGILPNPAGFSSEDSYSFTWNAGSDAHSGIGEYCYKTGAPAATDTCIAETTVSGITSYQEGTNVFYVRSKDVAGNLLDYYTSVNYYYSANAPSEPQNLQVDPASNTTNSFTFSWLEPASHDTTIAGYYYAINAIPNANNVTYTTQTTIGPDAFATQQGANVFYVVAVDTAGNKNWSSYSSIEFTASTSAPGIPTGIIVTDSSNREQGTFRLTVTWEEPDQVGGGIDHYKVERSDDGGDTYTEISQVTGTGYLDTGLTQNAWYCYQIKATDNAEAASAASSEVCEQARGRYYEAPSLVGNPGAETRIQSATIEWLTDRECSSFVEYGETTAYGSEAGQDDHLSSHSVNLIGLEPDTTYHYRVKFTDEDDNTGYSGDYTFETADAPSAPTSLAVAPTSNTTNSFKFTWGEPVDEGVTIEGYYYSINQEPSVTNSSYTAQTTLGPGPYATQQGTNTFYIVAIDDAGNINYDNHASIEFEANTAAPGAPTNMLIIDSSDRYTEKYMLTLTWDPPTTISSGEGEEVAYIIKRSTDNKTFEDISETQSIAYIDTSLSNETTYYYKVTAKDNAGAQSAASTVVSEIPEGRYRTPPTISAGPTVTPDSFTATITWETDREADSHAEYGLTEDLGEEQGTIEESDDHTVVLEGLNAETKYYYRIRSRDIDGNIALSSISSLTTLEAPRVSEVVVSDIKLYEATISWKTNKETTSLIDYGTTTDYGSVVYDTTGSSTLSHTLKLSGLSDGTTYHFRPTGLDATDNAPESGDYAFTTLTFPRVLSVSSENKAEGQTEVKWTTNVPTTSEVEYGNEDTPSKTQGNTALVTDHSVLVFGLEDATTYQFTVRGRDQFGYEAVSPEESFTTLEDTTPPIISDVRYEANTVGSGDTASVQIIVSWMTNEPTSSQLEYGEGLSSSTYTGSTDVNPELVIDHIMVIKDLEPARTYHFRVVATDKADNETLSDSYSVLTSRKRESFLQIVIDNLSDTFSWMSNMGNLF